MLGRLDVTRNYSNEKSRPSSASFRVQGNNAAIGFDSCPGDTTIEDIQLLSQLELLGNSHVRDGCAVLHITNTADHQHISYDDRSSAFKSVSSLLH